MQEQLVFVFVFFSRLLHDENVKTYLTEIEGTFQNWKKREGKFVHTKNDANYLVFENEETPYDVDGLLKKRERCLNQ